MRKWRSLTALRAFEAVARLGSVTAAAAELGVTRPAISKQIAALERDLAAPLIERRGNRIGLTAAGTELQTSLGQAFDLIAAATDRIAQRATGRAHLRLLVCRDFASSWLAGQLGSFLAAHPGISVDVTADRNDRFRPGEDFDFRIFYGPPAAKVPAGFRRSELCAWIDVPVCAPALAERSRAEGLALAEAPQLVDGNYDIWDDWCAHTGFVARPARQRTLFNETTLCLSVAASGGGIAIGDSFLALPMIRSGDLIVPFPQGLVSGQRYFLFAAEAPHGNRAAERFETWLRQAIDRYQSGVRAHFADAGIAVIERHEAGAKAGPVPA